MAKIPQSLKQPCAHPYEIKGDANGDIRAKEAALSAGHDRAELAECRVKHAALVKAANERDGVIKELDTFVNDNQLLTKELKKIPVPESRPAQ